MHITEIALSDRNWHKLETLIADNVTGFTFDSTKSYRIQADNDFLTVELATAPSENFNQGFSDVDINYKKGTGDLYIKNDSVEINNINIGDNA